MVTGDSQEEVIIFRDRQTNRQTLRHNIYIITTIIAMFQRELLDLLHGGSPVPERAQADAEDQILPADK